MRKLNFSSGPAVLPEEVLRRAQEAIWDLDGSGIGILEHSHRGKEFGRVLERAEAAVREVGGIGDDYAILFVTAGATHHFAMVPQNFLRAGETADYCHTGVWSGKAMDEARRCGARPRRVHAASRRSTHMPTRARWSAVAALRPLHEQRDDLRHAVGRAARGAPAPLVCDASSDIFSRPLAARRPRR